MEEINYCMICGVEYFLEDSTADDKEEFCSQTCEIVNRDEQKVLDD